MTTTGELRNIIEELELVDIGDAAIYLGEDSADDPIQIFGQAVLLPIGDSREFNTIDCSHVKF